MLRKLAYLVVFLILTACTSASGSVLSDPVLPILTDQTGWWVDTTGTLSRSTEQELEKLSDKIAKSGFQIGGAVFTNSISDPVDLATKFGNKVQLGSAEKDNGIAIVVLLDKKGRSGEKPSIGVAIGSGLEGLLNDAKIGRFLDQTFVPARSEGNWEKGVLSFVVLMERYLANPDADEFRDPPFTMRWQDWLTLVVVVILVLMIVIGWITGSSSGGYSSSGSSSRSGGSRGGGGSFGGGGASR